MSDPVLHIKDSYFFEVPKALWRADYTEKTQPVFLTKLHPNMSLDEFNKEMSGKILIPQPFGGELKDLHTPASGFCISKFMVLEVVVALLVFGLFYVFSKRLAASKHPSGRFVNAIEMVLLYLRDEVFRPAIGGKDADKFTPVLWTVFFFILGCNLMGMLPWLGAPTSSFSVTLSLAFVTLSIGFVFGVKKFGIAGYWWNMVPGMDLPWYMFPIKIMILAIEVLGLFIKHSVLGIRLLANMVAGHLVLLGVLGLISGAAAASASVWGITTSIAVAGSTLFSVLELGVAFLQAYIFTFLSALFISAAIHHH